MDYNIPSLLEKWEPVLNESSCPKIKDDVRAETTAIVLENMLRESGLSEAVHANQGGTGLALGGAGATTGATVAGYDPVLINLVRRAMPQMIAYDLVGVQALSQPTGLIFAIKARQGGQNGAEALFNEADTDFSGTSTAEAGRTGSGAHAGTGPFDVPYTYGTGMTTAAAENLGGLGGDTFNEMSFTIERTSVTAKTRALKAEYTVELEQDLQRVHGLSADGELSKFLATEIMAEMNREVIRNIYVAAKAGAQNNVATAGTFDLDVDANGRWSVEKFKGLMFQIERDANVIAQRTRRGKGNFLLCSSDVASALAMAGLLDYNPALQINLNVDEANTTFAGVLKNGMKVYIDPYASNYGANQFYTVGYKGQSAWDAGMYYCPYIPLQKFATTDPQTFQPKMAYKTRYGMVANPFAGASVATNGLAAGSNDYYARVKVQNLM